MASTIGPLNAFRIDYLGLSREAEGPVGRP